MNMKKTVSCILAILVVGVCLTLQTEGVSAYSTSNYLYFGTSPNVDYSSVQFRESSTQISNTYNSGLLVNCGLIQQIDLSSEAVVHLDLTAVSAKFNGANQNIANQDIVYFAITKAATANPSDIIGRCSASTQTGAPRTGTLETKLSSGRYYLVVYSPKATTGTYSAGFTHTARVKAYYTPVQTENQSTEPTGTDIRPPKSAQPMKVKAYTRTVKAKVLKKKARTIYLLSVKRAQGKVSYKVVARNAKAKKYLKVNKNNGKVTIKKKAKKGTYKIRIKVTAKGNALFKSGSKTVWATIKVK